VSLVLLAPAGGAELCDGPPPAAGPVAPPVFPDAGCVTGQTNDLNGQLGLLGAREIQVPCHEVPPGDLGDYKGFAFPLEACMTGGIDKVALNFRIADPGDPFILYIWRDLGGLPNDVCGLEAHLSVEYVEDGGLIFSMYDLCDLGIPLTLGERFWVGVVYKIIVRVFGADWYLGRNLEGGYSDTAYVNETGRPGAWADLIHYGHGNRFGVFVYLSDACGPVPVETSSWGAVKALMR
jgi:hypothetical protein